jgi:hypothetical protein
MASSRKTPTLCERDTRQLWRTNLYWWWEQGYSHMINRVGKMCVAAMSLCMTVLIVTRKKGDGRYYFALWQTNNSPNKLLLSESAVSCLLRCPPQREATTTNMWKKRIILESSRKLANQLKQPKHDYEFG